MQDPFVDNADFQAAISGTPFGVQPMVGFRRNVNYVPGATNTIPELSTTPSATSSGNGSGTMSFVTDEQDNDYGTGIPFNPTPTLPDTVYDIDTSFGVDDDSFDEGQDTITTDTYSPPEYSDDMTEYDDDLGAEQSPIQDNTSLNEGQSSVSSTPAYSPPPDFSGPESTDSGAMGGGSHSYDNDSGGGWAGNSSSSSDSGGYDFSGNWWSHGGKIPAIQTSNGGK
jgi:hypothetical protein